MNTPYKQCPHCGAAIDAGEVCDCKAAPASGRATAETATVAPQEAAYYGRNAEQDKPGGHFSSPSGPLRGIPRRY